MEVFYIKEYNQNYSGTQIAKLRIDRGFDSEKKLADALEVSQQSIQQIESGKKKISLKMLSELKNILNTSTDYLLGLTDDPEQKPTVVDELNLSPEAKDALKKIASRAPADREVLSAFIESDEFSELISSFAALQTTKNSYQMFTIPYLISLYKYAPGISIDDPLDRFRLKRLEIDDCITQYLESEYQYSNIKKELQHNINLAITAIEAEEKNDDGIT